MSKHISYWLGGMVMGAIWGLSIADKKKKDYQQKIKNRLFPDRRPMKKLMTYLWGTMEDA